MAPLRDSDDDAPNRRSRRRKRRRVSRPAGPLRDDGPVHDVVRDGPIHDVVRDGPVHDVVTRPDLLDGILGGRDRPGWVFDPVTPGDDDGSRPDHIGPASRGHYSSLDDGVPLLMLPVRLETRFAGPVATRQLKVRIYPDQVHLDDHQPRLTREEREIGQEYWRAAHEAVDDEGQAAARSWLASQLPARRAAWVARQTEPAVDGDTLTFPERPLRKKTAAARAGALPAKWALIGYTEDQGVLRKRFVAWTSAVKPDLALSLDAEDFTPWSEEDGALAVDPGLAWMTDYPTAVDAGMGVTIDLSKYRDIAEDGLALLVAVGVSQEKPAKAANALAGLLEAHNYTDGLAFVPQGTPTNNTEEVASGWSFREDDLAGLFGRELDGREQASEDDHNGVRAAAALGLPDNEVLRRVAEADRDEESSQRAMNHVLWPVTWGQYFDVLLANKAGQTTVPREGIVAAKTWFLDHVRGGAPLPSLRIGSQPYGVLPASLLERKEQWRSSDEWFAETLLHLEATWRQSVLDVPRMDPVLGASRGTVGNDPDSVLVDILSTLPHPARFLLRDLRNWREKDYETEWAIILALFGLIFLVGKDPTYDHESLSVLGRWGWGREVLTGDDYLNIPRRVFREMDKASLRNVDAQLAELDRLLADPSLTGAQDIDDARSWLRYMRGQVERHKERQPPLNEMNAPIRFSGVLSNDVDDPAIVYSMYDEDSETKQFTRALVSSEHATTSGYLASLRERVPTFGRVTLPGGPLPGPMARLGLDAGPVSGPRDTTPTPRPSGLSSEFHADEPLLYQLIDSVVNDLPGGPAGDAYRRALDDLRDVDDDEVVELRLRETLGLASHRLDAWVTAIARSRLEALRSERAGGIQLGGFGWVHDLAPDAAGTTESQGFIHTPSLQHAATAAILRSGWSVHGTEDEASSLAVDLRGGRVQLASWLLDGVRQGQALGALLGYRFERALQDGLQDWIDPVRRAVLEDQGITRGPRGPVDGLDLADLFGRGGLSSVLSDAERAGDREALLDALEGVEQAMDAVGDAAIAESIHQVAQGNTTRAAATLDAISLGEVPPPELQHVETPRRGAGVSHRVVALLAGSGSDWSSALPSPRATLEPRLESWAAHLLGAPGRIQLAATVRDDKGTVTAGPFVVTMDDLDLSALDAVFEAPTGEPSIEGAWGRRVLAALAPRLPEGTDPSEVVVDFEAEVSADAITFSEAAELARALRSLLSSARPLDGRDLVTPDLDAEPGWDLEGLRSRVMPMSRRFRARVQVLADLLPEVDADDETADPRPVGTSSLADLRDAMLDLTGYGLPGALPLAGVSEDDREALYAEAWALADAAGRRVQGLDDDRAAWTSDPTDLGWLRRLRGVVDRVLGRGFPLLPEFTAPAGGLENLAAGGDLVADDPGAPWAWLTQVGRVRAEMGRLTELAELSELLVGETRLPVVVSQAPRVEGEAWVARSAITPDTGGRVSWVALDHGGGLATSGTGCVGLVLDEWVEQVPSTETVTGLAVHFDAPASRAPQSLLLVVPPEGRSWDFDLVADTVRQTFERARMRAVAPENLAAYGHHLPAIYPPTRLSAGPQPKVEEGA